MPASPAPVFAALGDETRLHLMVRLGSEGPLSIKRLTEGGQITRQAMTKHLLVMEGAGLVAHRKHGRESLWNVEQRRLAEARQYLEVISTQWDDALARLRQFVENS